MSAVPEQKASSESPFDTIAEDLQRLRLESGQVSYAEIATRIAKQREAAGQNASAARVARSTVFDAFRTGRQRINPELVAEIVIALGESQTTAETWRARCLDAHRPNTRQLAARPISHPGSRAVENFHLHTSLIVTLLVACVGINIFGNTVAAKFSLPVFLDMIGTATAAIVLGPWYGAFVGLTTNLLATIAGSPQSLPFALVNVVGGLAWGYGFHRFGLGRTPLKFLMLNLIVAFSCTIVAVPITVFFLGGSVTHASDSVTASFIALGQGIWVAVFSANIISSVADKLISGYLALLASKLLAPLNLREKPPAIVGSLAPRRPSARALKLRARAVSGSHRDAGAEAASTSASSQRL